MAKINMDTVKVRVAGEELVAISKEYNNIINELYSKINEISKNGTWKSDDDNGAANKFIGSILKDRASVQSIATSINQLGSAVIKYAKSINSVSDNDL